MPTSLSQCKKQLRDATRLLARSTLSSTKRQEVERRVKALGMLQTQFSGAKVDKANAAKYSGVKFVERKKVIRSLEKLEKLGKKSGESAAKSEILDLLVSLNYTTYYPDQFKYISLFPSDPKRTTEETRDKQRQIRESIKLAMEAGNLPKDPRLVSSEDTKAIRKSNKLVLQTVSLAHGQTDSGSKDEDEEDGDDDEFFA
ncbi:18S rRNA maturation protein [Coemansia sp. RSA 2320]|nr:18S rRNA maturation protein [Coemansia sp. RSA 2320]